MDKIQHKRFQVGELNLHVAEIGSGPAVLLLHGFPEIWYSWRHQMIALAEAGFHAIAPDFRGYGLSDQPSEPEKAAYYDLVEDTVGLLDALGIDKVLRSEVDQVDLFCGAQEFCYKIKIRPQTARRKDPSAMDKIQHKQVNVGGLNLHVAEIGSGPAVLLLHGFPEIWYSWRHQMIALAEAGFHAIAPDFRGYGLSDQPSEPEKAGFYDLVEDMVGLLDALGIDKVLVVGKDFGAIVAYYLDLCHPDRVKGIVTLGIPYLKPGALEHWDSAPKGLYFRHWQEPGRGLADLGRFDAKTVVRNIYTLFSSSELPVAEDGKEVMDLYDPSKPLPLWFTEDDLQMYSSLYEKSGFVFPMQVPYLCSKRDQGRLTLFSDRTIQAPSLLIVGTKDYFMKFPGVEYYVNSEMLKSAVPNLEINYFPEGSHFVQEQFPEEVNKLLLGFLNQHL